MIKVRTENGDVFEYSEANGWLVTQNGYLNITKNDPNRRLNEPETLATLVPGFWLEVGTA